MTFKIDITVSKLVDPAFRKEQITETVAKAKKLFADGVNIDVEQAVKKDSPEAKALTAFSKEMTDAFHKEIPGSQVCSQWCAYSHLTWGTPLSALSWP